MSIEPKILTPEEFGNILWPGMFPEGWREINPSDAMQQARFYCLEKSEKMLRVIEVRMK